MLEFRDMNMTKTNDLISLASGIINATAHLLSRSNSVCLVRPATFFYSKGKRDIQGIEIVLDGTVGSFIAPIVVNDPVKTILGEELSSRTHFAVWHPYIERGDSSVGLPDTYYSSIENDSDPDTITHSFHEAVVLTINEQVKSIAIQIMEVLGEADEPIESVEESESWPS